MLDELAGAEEVWLSSATKEVAPVVAIDGRAVGDGAIGPLWQRAQSLFSQHRYDY